MIKNVVFDIGNVLVDFNWLGVMRGLSFTDDEIRKAAGLIIGTKYWDNLDAGIMPEQEAVDIMKGLLPEIADKLQAFWEHLEETIQVYPYSDGWLKGLQERGYKTFLLSNYPKTLFQKNEKDQFTFLPYTDGRIISSYVQKLKPNADIYNCLLETYGLKAEETVFIDDKKVNVEGAEAVGIRAILFDNFENVNAKLEEMLAEK
ncbi:MAG: HAD family phosphatase [Lachnospiraceae bacterium]|nr:HAD family phosphatase [Lachnospiraceae bacterium]